MNRTQLLLPALFLIATACGKDSAQATSNPDDVSVSARGEGVAAGASNDGEARAVAVEEDGRAKAIGDDGDEAEAEVTDQNDEVE